ncbi:hypothetical protein AGABI1DRAFT_134790 [Agaricus bisporus var. burnettii JB137-S8]|uniref:Uncharacterized protein n=1 Tax=Agaricus bisporus var. burnettii (strain JB137-S8 / ATCC MYA-4627 / FGSC 10392) TaxID=597362 RepID=K5XGA4_AGABU|nr:uncharacterized protein AGABI1DRAFT_134790 [Agaricus bisporus var. burnettii JB137-S8]EKM73430.1 hypothetical protein AGABI1DRAFT_134790 [Agaricus bisporus var. burnettii JB137-S8]
MFTNAEAPASRHVTGLLGEFAHRITPLQGRQSRHSDIHHQRYPRASPKGTNV